MEPIMFLPKHLCNYLLRFYKANDSIKTLFNVLADNKNKALEFIHQIQYLFNMRKNIYPYLFTLLAFVACRNGESFSALQKKETNQMNAYIAREGIKVVTSLPQKWDEKVYFKSPTGLYFRLENQGDTNIVLNPDSKTRVGLWMIEYELDEQKTVRSKQWVPGDVSGGQPLMMTYGDVSYIALLGAGMYEAIGLMKYHNATAKIIVPSSLNTRTYADNLKPVSYDLKLQLKLIN